ncbi:MAG: hypothetical protein F4X20_08340 [Dehalococcoidia bacterium]|nr:hypothetical protein [Dehalococcoidia bacterium]
MQLSLGRSQTHRWLAAFAVLLIMLVAATVMSGCFFQEDPTPTPNPFLIPGTSELEYRDDELGFSFRYQDDWLISDPEDTEGIVVSLVSPERTVTVDIERDLPPPQIDFISYGSARMRFFQQLQPSLEIVEETETTLTDGTPAYHANWVSRAVDAETTGETLVVFRGEGDAREAFMIVSSGPSSMYSAWTGPILFFYETITIDPA